MRLPPGPPDRFFGLAAYPAFSGNRIGALARLARKYGDVVTFRVGRQRMVLLNHPDYVEDVLVTRARLVQERTRRSSARSGSSAKGC